MQWTLWAGLLAVVAGCAELPHVEGPCGGAFAPAPVPVTAYRPFPDPPPAPVTSAVCITPKSVVAPVGSEVVLLAAVRGEDNYLRTNERVEWSIAPGGVGHFVGVGKNGFSDILFMEWYRGKVDNTYAVGTTMFESTRLTRGTPTPCDDVLVAAGQSWVSLTSPLEGVSYVTAYAPYGIHWDQNKQTAVVHWTDAHWQFPPPAINAAGTRHVFTTVVTRHTNTAPCVGWRVRYQVLDGPAAGFAPQGANVAEVDVNPAGQADAELFQATPAPGTNRIGIQILRYDAPGAVGRPFVVASGSSLMTWTAPQIAIRKSGPSAVALGSQFTYHITLSNPGDQPAADVSVTDEIPTVMTLVGSNPPAENNGGRLLRWPVGRIGPRESRNFDVTLRASQRATATSCAEATAAGGLRARDCATTTVATANIGLAFRVQPQVIVGSRVSFEVLITNRGSTPASELLIKDRFEPGLEHPLSRDAIERVLGNIAPGQTKSVTVDFKATRAGRLCHTVEIRDASGLLASAQGCVTAVEATAATPAPTPRPAAAPPVTTNPPTTTNPPYTPPVAPPSGPPPSVSVHKDGPSTCDVKKKALFTSTITNTGRGRLTNVKVIDRYDAALQVKQATDGWKLEGTALSWLIPSLEPGKSEIFEVEVEPQQALPRACSRVTISTAEGASAADDKCVQIRETIAAPPISPPSNPPIIPPITPANPPATPQAQSTLTISVAALDNPVVAGKDVRYDVLVTNPGPAAERNVTVSATLPGNLMPGTFGTHGPTAPTLDGQTFRFEPLTELPAGQSAKYRITGRAIQPGDARFHAEVTSQAVTRALPADVTTQVTGPQ